MKQKVIFRADGNNEVGLGHVSRCIALAELLSHSFDTCFAIQNPHDDLLATIGRITDDIIILPFTLPEDPAFIRELYPFLSGEEMIVLDGYHFTTTYESELKKHARAVVTIDDIPSRRFVADVVINFCGGINPRQYQKEFYTQLLTGLEYLFLRTPFLRTPPDKQFNNRLFLNMGGTDPNNHSVEIVTKLFSLGYKGQMDIVVGNDYRFYDILESIVKSNASVTLHRGLNAGQMYQLMSRCSLAILPPSTVALEFLSTGGLAFLLQTASNQSMLKKYLLDLNLAFDYDTFSSLSHDKVAQGLFETTLQIQKKLFDGASLKRVKNLFDRLSLGSMLTLRQAGNGDMKVCFDWANDPEARKYSYSTEPIPWDRHVAWFKNKMADPGCFYFIASVGDENVGQIRFEFVERVGGFQISYSIDKNWRGKGLSHFLLAKSIQYLLPIANPQNIFGFVQKKNEASIRAFQRAGFDMFPTDMYADSFKFELSLSGKII